MNVNKRDRRLRSGFALVELLVVVSIVAIAGAIAVAAISMASRSAGMRKSRAAVSSAIRRASSHAAKSGVTEGIDLWSIPVDSTVRVRTESSLPLPEGANATGSVDLQGGTGKPYTNGANCAVAVLLEDTGDAEKVVAIVLGPDATVTEYRWSGGEWEVLR